MANTSAWRVPRLAQCGGILFGVDAALLFAGADTWVSRRHAPGCLQVAVFVDRD
jgi:hypothetical protein